MQVWIVSSCTGEYSDEVTVTVKIFSEASKAKKFVDDMNADLILNCGHTSNKDNGTLNVPLDDNSIHGYISYTGMSYHYSGPYEVE